jgi:hypothetical protein
MFKEKREIRMRNGRGCFYQKEKIMLLSKAKGGIFNVHGPLLEGSIRLIKYLN